MDKLDLRKKNQWQNQNIQRSGKKSSLWYLVGLEVSVLASPMDDGRRVTPSFAGQKDVIAGEGRVVGGSFQKMRWFWNNKPD